ncbi:unnamed protein product [Arctia plantaginis]|uniref:YqaJ viral recombinase domain-containing protein n=1 Tax=Arctia plantaginis TaxID=874455 RepID=A0A8S1AJP6_ARCPL|nr:unnamed protein product [Arctia plantaginis]
MESHMNDTVEVVVEEKAPDKDIEKNTGVEEESSISIEDNERSDREDPTYIASDSSSDQDDEYSECLITDDSLVATQSDAVIREKKRVRRVPERTTLNLENVDPNGQTIRTDYSQAEQNTHHNDYARNEENAQESSLKPRATRKRRPQTQSTIPDENLYDAAERVIIDKVYFFEKLKIISNHAPQIGCTLSNLNIIGETKLGLNSKLKLSYYMCRGEFIINTSDPQPTQNLDINTAAVSGITSAYIGLEQFQGLCIAMNLPSLTQQLYRKKHTEICDQWEKTAHKLMEAAAERERLAAIEEGKVKNGVAVIDVIADGCWSKRSYKSNYAALSGAAAIVVSVSKDTKYSLPMRKMVTTQRILAIRKVICCAIKKHKAETLELGERINKLYTDISNSCNHAFRHHTKCLDHYCRSEKKNEDLVLRVKNSAFWAKIQYIVGIVAAHSRSLINDCDSNAVEQFNCIIATFVGGKRTNLVQRQTYQSRCAAAVVAFNTNRPLYNIQKSLLGKSPKSKSKTFEGKKIQKNKLRRKLTRRRINFNEKLTTTDKHYGTDSCHKPDMEEYIYRIAKESFLKSLEKSNQERLRIERATILQRDSSEWLELRRNLLTASNFGKIIKRRPTTSASIVKAKLYKSDISNVASIKHDVDNETIALNQLAAKEGVEIRSCGLFIDSEIPFLAATPDGLVGNDTIVEIKCPMSAFNMPIKEAVEKRKIKFWNIKDGTMVVNTNDTWYYQIQGQLHITKINGCLFAVWLGERQAMAVEKIQRDEDFWEKKKISKLTDFHMDHILPELIDPRHTRNMPLRHVPLSVV